MEKRTISLKSIFLIYLIISFLIICISVIIPFLIYNLLINAEIILPANYTENIINKNIEILSKIPKIQQQMLPKYSSYIILKKDLTPKEGNMKEQEIKEAIKYAKGEITNTGKKKNYKLIKRKDELLIIQFYIQPNYANEKLNKYLPNPDRIILIIIILKTIILIILISMIFAKYLKKELKPLIESTEKIKQKNLDFKIKYSKIKEFNNIIDSIENMKNNLKESLEKQWSTEQLKNDQISMLSHDIKTPLTIIRGNSELLKEISQEKNFEEYINAILESSKEIESYVKTLLNITKNEKNINIDFKKINSLKFIENLYLKTKALTKVKNIKIILNKKNIPIQFKANESLLYRAIINILDNAINNSPANTTIQLNIEKKENTLKFIIIDNGKGFSKEALKYAKTKFYMENKSRSAKGHYGIGLYTATMITNLHKGNLILENSNNGAKVTIEIPI
ncbi:MAG: two-component system, OmpR family, lantibiotic biosynthesis sensor histidine kinase NisK/SpaK [Oceanotoga sp.]|jgi:signal transduction histidine kinase|uniref:sensor histidine kinase n=1 Tax=Oceanotoga sp. TaxID=2108366 RepID=UPI00265462A1|nr:HAMP domain-containing sensor histidine kinase [Oceanotoga sp.]MDN5341429.1 two-component system, OmpR family, lantibiotic biosynthesis sensor histidine kinase NisK/SpaK [Oceanotoga sp.]